MIHIVDYGLGNIQAISTCYKLLDIEIVLAKSEDDLRNARKLILPGVGSFDHAMGLLNASGMRQSLETLVRVDKLPVLGICVGMQMLAHTSEEGVSDGLKWVDGHVCSFASNPDSALLPRPHMGWNDVVPSGGSPLFKGLSDDARFYFLHSYYFECPDSNNVSARCDYGLQFACAVQNDNVFGVQFHPEKSHHWGAMLLKNFAEI